MSLETKALYEFGRFRCEPGEHLLLCDGKPVSLTPKCFDLLMVLVESRGRLVTKEELLRRVWPNSFVEEANLTVNISALRKILGETPKGDSYIETVPKKGYRFIAPVRQVSSEVVAAAQPDSPAPAIAQSSTPARSAPTFWIVAAVVLGLVIAGMTYLSVRPRRNTIRTQTPSRLAVLPFRNLANDQNMDFLSLSLPDTVISKLAYVSALTVRPSSSTEKYAHGTVDLNAAAQELKVDALLTGNYLRDGEDLRISCQLVDAKSESILWRNTFDVKYDKLLTVHDQVARKIIQGLEVTLTPSEAQALKPDEPIDPLAYEYYLRGVDLYARGDFPFAIRMLEKSAAIAPAYAMTWAYLGRAHTAGASFQFGGVADYKQAQEAFERALKVQPQQIEARIYMANLLTDTGKVEQAVPLLRAALKDHPNHAELHWELGYAYRFAGMLPESASECEQARRIDPDVKLTSSALNAYLYMGQYDRFLQSLPQVEDSPLITFYRGFGEYYEKQVESAARDFDHAFEIDASLFQARVGKALSYGSNHLENKGLEVLREAEARIRERGVGDPEAIYKIAQAYAVLGDKPSALRVLRYSVEHGFFSYPYFQTDPLLDSLREDTEFASIMAQARERHQAFRKAYF